MLHIAEDGSAIVSQVPVPPFVPLQHQQVNVTTVNHLANYTLRMARERGWLQTQEDVKKATDFYESNDARPLLEQEGYAHKGDDLTFFYAGVEAALAARQPHFHYPPVPSTLFLWCHFFASHVGTSSYTIYGELYVYLESRGEASRQPLGHFKVTTVQVSKSLRTALPIPAARRAIIAAACAGTAGYLAEHVADAGISRLDVRGLLAASEQVEDPLHTDFNKLSFCAHHGSTVNCADKNKVIRTRFRKLHPLRESDMDFNFHVNQLATQQLVVNTFRAALRDDTTDVIYGGQNTSTESLYVTLLNDNVKPLIGDLLLRKIRIDYVREIPMAHEATEVFLFPLNDASLEKMAKSKPGARLNELAEIGFFTCGVPKVADDERFLASAGVFSCYV